MENQNIEVREVSGYSATKEFIKIPWEIYKDEKCWVPPLISERQDFLNPQKNPFFKHAEVKLFIAYKKGRPCGRIASIINHNHNDFHDEKVGFFGFFESIDDYIVAYGLLEKAREHANKKGMNLLRGPVNLSTNDEAGLLVHGFYSPPVIMMPYNLPYYMSLFERFGLSKAMDLIAYFLNSRAGVPSRVTRVAEKIRKRYDVEVRPLNMKKFNEEVQTIKYIYNNAWSKLWGFVPMTDEEFDHMAKLMKQIVDPGLALLAYVKNKPAGFCLSLPNVNEILIKLNGRLFPTGIFKLFYYAHVKKIIRSARTITMGILPPYQKRGIDNLLYIESVKRAAALRYEWAELSWVLENNTLMNRAADLLKAKAYKKYRIYEMEV